MSKDELIEQLSKIEGNPQILIANTFRDVDYLDNFTVKSFKNKDTKKEDYIIFCSTDTVITL